MKFDEYDTICPIEIRSYAADGTLNPSSDLHNRASLYFDMIFKLYTIRIYLVMGIRLTLEYGLSSLEVSWDQKAKYSVVSGT